MEAVTLPVCIEDIAAVTECWTFNRLVAIRNSPFYADWIASHYNLFVDTNNYNFLFGDISAYPFTYYEAILKSVQINLSELSQQNVIERMKGFIKEKFYLIASLDYDEEYLKAHELLVYGFDEKRQVFLSIKLIDGRFQKTILAFSEVEEIFDKVQNYFLDNGTGALKMSLLYQYPMTAIKVNDFYSLDHCAFDAYRKLILEVNGKEITQNSMYNFDICNDRDDAHIVTGIKTLKVFQQMLQNIIDGEELSVWFNGVDRAAKKIHEHQKMIHHTMEYLANKWEKALSEFASDCINKYNSCVLMTEKWKYMCIKYEKKQDPEILKRIIDEIPAVYETEIHCLQEFVNDSFNWHRFNKYYV